MLCVCLDSEQQGEFEVVDGFGQLQADSKEAADEWVNAIRTNVSVLARKSDTYEGKANFLTMRRSGSRWEKLLRRKPKTADK